MVVVAGYVLEADRYGLVRHPTSCPVGPFDQNDRVTVDNVIPRKVREIIGTSQPVKVEMKDSCALSMMFIHERERRAGHIFENSDTAANGLRQCGLASAEFAFEGDDGGRLETPTELLAPALQLVNRDS